VEQNEQEQDANGNKCADVWEQYRRKPLGMVGLSIVIVYVFVAIFAPFLNPVQIPSRFSWLIG